jgi:hypothetical protein
MARKKPRGGREQICRFSRLIHEITTILHRLQVVDVASVGIQEHLRPLQARKLVKFRKNTHNVFLVLFCRKSKKEMAESKQSCQRVVSHRSADMSNCCMSFGLCSVRQRCWPKDLLRLGFQIQKKARDLKINLIFILESILQFGSFCNA